MTDKVLLLNADYSPIDIIHWQEAARLVYKYGANSVNQLHPRKDKTIKTSDNEYEWPSVITLRRYIDLKNYITGKEKKNPSRQAIFKRDLYTCVYCGSRSQCTLDHVIPQSKGGKNTWGNLVTACISCNSKKSDLPLDEFLDIIGTPVDWDLRKVAYRPHPILQQIGSQEYPEEWDFYLKLN